MTTRRNTTIALLALASTACAAPAVARAPSAPVTGEAVVHLMHDRYAGKWFSTLTFVQTTTLIAPDGRETKQTWYEAFRGPDSLRIDMGSPADGNGALATVDSMFIVDHGVVRQRIPRGNPFLPFIAGIYLKPVDASVRDLRSFHFDLSAMHESTWQGSRVYVVGTSTKDDLQRDQFWVDADRLVAVRVLQRAGGPGSPVQDIRLDGYVPVGPAWLSTKVSLLVGGKARQVEEYADYRVNVPLDARLFDLAAWTQAPHWTAGASKH